MKKITEAEYVEASEQYIGWCPLCGEFTRECTEPDAVDYDCPKCRDYSVVGADNALLMGLIIF